VLDALRARAGDDQRAEIDRLIGVLDGQGAAPRRAHLAATAWQVDILHLSDLHLGSPNDAQRLHSQLAEDLKRELGCTRLDGMILSGDMTMVCAEDEYAAARAFIDAIAGEFGLPRERIVLIPGNHDLSWSHAKAAYKPGRRTDYLAANDADKARWTIERQSGGLRKRDFYQVRDEPLYRERFRLFSDALCEPITGSAYPLEYAEQFRFHHWPDLNLLVLGLNSAWEIDHHYEDRAAIHPLSVTNALNALRSRSESSGSRSTSSGTAPMRRATARKEEYLAALARQSASSVSRWARSSLRFGRAQIECVSFFLHRELPSRSGYFRFWPTAAVRMPASEGQLTWHSRRSATWAWSASAAYAASRRPSRTRITASRRSILETPLTTRKIT
jgi:hypothetical protein